MNTCGVRSSNMSARKRVTPDITNLRKNDEKFSNDLKTKKSGVMSKRFDIIIEFIAFKNILLVLIEKVKIR